MLTDDVRNMAALSVKKVAYLEKHPMGYMILSALAGIYVGFGIILIFSVGAPFAAAGSAATKLVMGASFGIALALVIFAGSELFTGNNMCGVIGALSKVIRWSDVGRLFLFSYIGNFIGSFFLAYLVAKSGAVSAETQSSFILQVAAAKMHKTALQLFLLGILCNWLVCLAVWTSARTTNDVAKILLIFWTLFAFISSGFEHSIANQTLLSLALFLPHGVEISWQGLGWNLLYVTAGNIVGGGLFVGALYWYTVSPTERVSETSGEPQVLKGKQKHLEPIG